MVSKNVKAKRRQEHLPTLAVTAFWFWIILLVLLCGCGALFISIAPIFPKPTAAPPRIILPKESVQTETPRSSPTPPPTQTETPPPLTAKVIELRVNLRAAPSTNAKIIGTVVKNDQFTLLGRSQDGKWYQASLVGKTAPVWVFGGTLQIVSGDPKTLPVVTTP